MPFAKKPLTTESRDGGCLVKLCFTSLQAFLTLMMGKEGRAPERQAKRAEFCESEEEILEECNGLVRGGVAHAGR